MSLIVMFLEVLDVLLADAADIVSAGVVQMLRVSGLVNEPSFATRTVTMFSKNVSWKSVPISEDLTCESSVKGYTVNSLISLCTFGQT